MTVKTLVGAADDPLRKALLASIADSLAAMQWMAEHPREAGSLLPCCWLPYERIEGGRPVGWIHRLCSDSCQHFHHEFEIWLAGGAP